MTTTESKGVRIRTKTDDQAAMLATILGLSIGRTVTKIEAIEIAVEHALEAAKAGSLKLVGQDA